MNGQMIASIKAAEDMLAREHTKQQQVDAQKVLESLPEDHPIIAEFNSNPALAQDLGNLPPGHPLLRALMDAKRRYEEQIAAETQETQEKTSERRHEGRAKQREAEAKRRAEEEADRQERVMAGKTLNDQIIRATGQLESLYQSMQDLSPTLENDPYCRVKMKKLERLLVACKRGFDECKISTTRI